MYGTEVLCHLTQFLYVKCLHAEEVLDSCEHLCRFILPAVNGLAFTSLMSGPDGVICLFCPSGS